MTDSGPGTRGARFLLIRAPGVAFAMVIRLVKHSDFDAIAALTNVFIRETPIHFGYAQVTSDELFQAWHQTRERYPFLVVEHDGRFAGFAKAGVWRSREAYAWTTETGIYLESWARGRGIGKALYAALLGILRTQGFHSVVTGITMPNAASEQLHRSVGFQCYGVVKHAGFKFGRWHDVSFWQVMLTNGEAPAASLKSPDEAWAAHTPTPAPNHSPS
ncbi:MAG: GNAT family N-acetyltransferase [Planctomycetota bacterium]|nr:GNAT family N-acetyltransferase [Planctomycetota bacterium]